MARILLLGTWLTSLESVREALVRRNGDRLSFGGLAGQLEVTGPRIEIERGWIVNDRTWRHGMPRSVADGRIDQLTDDLFVVVDEPAPDSGRRGRRPAGSGERKE
jgi:hypothetical protein